MFHGLSLSALELFINDMRYINPRFTYLLTYLLTLCLPRWTLVSSAETAEPSWTHGDPRNLVLGAGIPTTGINSFDGDTLLCWGMTGGRYTQTDSQEGSTRRCGMLATVTVTISAAQTRAHFAKHLGLSSIAEIYANSQEHGLGFKLIMPVSVP